MSKESSRRQPIKTVRFPSMVEVYAMQSAARRARNLAISAMFHKGFTAIGRVVVKTLDWLSRPREPHLLELDDRMLKDIGITRADAYAAASRPRNGAVANSNRTRRAA